MHSTRKRYRLLFLAIVSLALAGNRPDCDGDPPTLTCSSPSLQLDPGECVEFTNPCGDNEWHRLDTFRLCDQPQGLFVRSERNPRARFLCATAATALGGPMAVEFYYVNTTDAGEGAFSVTVGSGLTVSAFASPPTISEGGSSQLTTVITGGVGPFTFSWNPTAGLDEPMAQNPIATPLVSTNYTVTVTDANGASASAVASVNVGIGVEVSGDSPINTGEASQLLANVSGGVPPYSFAWTPADSLDDPTLAGPLATPVNTTIYGVVVTDQLGAQAFGSTTVAVNIDVTASADPPSVDRGDAAQLDATVSGGLPPYSYSWAPAGSLDDHTVPDPVASPLETTDYVLVVTDSLGAQGTANVQLEVVSTGLVADLQPVFLSPVLLQIDASGSLPQASIIEYKYWCHYVPGFTLPEVSSSNLSSVCGYDDPPGTEKTLRLEVSDGVNSAEDTLVVTLPF